ncbi:Stk1 family PASTA domain-containing Ser/Thr kinase [Paenarthrobacter aurescens]|uniref:non-specific serine/threonine protein kinase n=1 Tax=Paenarthrobacter aurescens TaxID=43663 RepID=A0A4Y3NG15_PAEAU|nr:Stk1 family PASTA domain-containing Ser/Thr kinase [Paenarthrobacter aurescens]MDO6143213.1 Stk1 family PASTA domain-containing Ser/Thr kinase [Paenarthrobacter aurescens]MDO6147059.1 Stk1 family PASTA domain-containing Ser/Thr kinase [Paenarthrobacter aurescens]MDO6158305.1 Stk1 family PASTA domain-containing Ser/Thr kinase [Paenarthrobacter aurescens]MDO6162289.1 Stk1 family PASTA domain-containing Ser/Thr kinase [Paenarthrobacter aurescens]GEB20203.1 putative serine/threonine-protein kin
MVQEPTQDHLIGTTVDGRYTVRSRLARGGMSTVYLATDQRLERDVALKVLHPHLANDPTFLARLSREAKAAASLSHPHIVGVLDQGEDGHIAYLVMEYVKGHTLRDTLNEQGPLPPRLALALIDPVIEGLAAAHHSGLIHRDVKPENVLIADDGRIKVGDFGLARAISANTSTGALIGTVAYLAPELVLGQPADARSDIYSAGIMLYEMLTGKQPYAGDSPIQVAYQHVNAVVGRPSDAAPGLAEDLDELVQWCTAVDAENRPVDGAALLTELRHIRTTLTDEELDRRQTSSQHPGFLPAAGATTPLDSSGSNPTEALATTASPTELISHQSNPTTIMAAGGPGRPQAGALVPAVPGNDADGRQPGKRELKRLERQESKDRARAAATPSRPLREGNPRRRGIIWTIVIVILATLAASAGWFFGMGPGSPGTVPDVKNKTVAEAQQLLRTAGFQSEPQDVFDDDILAGLAVGTEPASGAEVRKFQPITLFVSKGAQLFPLPGLAGGTLDEAKIALNAAEMALGNVTQAFDEKVPAGVVLSQDPAKGTEVRHGTPVSLVVSKGPQPIPVPDVRGLAQDAAVKAIQDAGLTAVIAPETVNDKTVPKGAVVSQLPANGTLIRGEAVTLTVSKGPKLVKVPSFIGKQAAEAERELKKLGFKVEVNKVLGGFFGTVRDQNPVNTEVPEDSVVTLTVV